MSGRIVHYAQLTPKRTKVKHPHGLAHYPVEMSFNAVGGGWIRMRDSCGSEIDLGPEEQHLLMHLLINRNPLDALAAIKGDEDDEPGPARTG